MKEAGIAAIAGGETPGPIPNPEDKPARVPCCTELRERSGSRDCCYARSISLLNSKVANN